MKHKLVVYVVDGTTTNRTIWSLIDADVEAAKAAHQRLLEASQMTESMMAEPLADDETIEDRQKALPKIVPESWIDLYVCEPVYHTGPERCLKGITCMLVLPGTEAIATDYQAKGVRCLAIDLSKTGRWFPPLTPLHSMPADLSGLVEDENRWKHGVTFSAAIKD